MAEQLDLIVRQGELVLPGGRVMRGDVAIRHGIIAAIEPRIDESAAEEIDASGLMVFPGFIDPHTHMGIPILDTFSADDFESGSRAAAAGGITTILDFTVQRPGQSLEEALQERLGLAEGRCHVDFNIHVNVTDRPEQWLPQIASLCRRGFTSFKVFSTYRQAGMMISWPQFRQVLAAVRDAGGLLMLHAEDNALIERDTEAHLQAGRLEPIYHARSRTPEAEAAAIRRAAEIAGELEAPLYIVHLSSAAGLETALEARRQGVQIYLETCPQYLLLDESRYLQENGAWYITTPPLRTAADCQALWAALARGDIDTVGTDHCPFTRAQKEAGKGQFHRIPNGLPGIEWLFPLLYSYGVAGGRLSLKRLLEVLAENTARLFGLAHRKGRLAPGMDADLVLWDPATSHPIDGRHQSGRADWSPYQGFTLNGQVVCTLVRGRVLVTNGRFVGHTSFGQLVPARVGG